MIFFVIAAVVVAAEWKIKDRMERSMKEGVVREVAGDKLLLRKCHNEGIAGGLLREHPDLVKGGTAGVLLCVAVELFYNIKRGGSALVKLGYALTLGGGLSNLLDRICRGYVTDYFSFNVEWKRLRRLVFNLADVCVLAGSLLVLAGKLFGGEKRCRR